MRDGRKEFTGVYEGDLTRLLADRFAELGGFGKWPLLTAYHSTDGKTLVEYVVQSKPGPAPAWGRDLETRYGIPLTHVRISGPAREVTRIRDGVLSGCRCL
jgi:hypothetical protein